MPSTPFFLGYISDSVSHVLLRMALIFPISTNQVVKYLILYAAVNKCKCKTSQTGIGRTRYTNTITNIQYILSQSFPKHIEI
jgi:hypothetical protein